MITIVDYGIGNVGSVLNMVRKVGGVATATSRREDVMSASHLILPGVGAFDYGVQQLKRLDLFSALVEKARSGTPLLGICLGMQLLGVRSEEGVLEGLRLIDATFRRFSCESERPLPIPHVGWREVRVIKDNPLIGNDEKTPRFYFTHSYHAVCADEQDVLATAEYGYVFTAAYCRGNVFGVQFHPEKSHRFGMVVIKNFLSIR